MSAWKDRFSAAVLTNLYRVGAVRRPSVLEQAVQQAFTEVPLPHETTPEPASLDNAGWVPRP